MHIPILIYSLEKSNGFTNSKDLYNQSNTMTCMVEEEKKFSKQLIGKTVVSKTGKKFGEIGDVIFEARSGELMHMVLVNPTGYCQKLDLEKDKEGKILIPFSAVIAVGDFMVISEEDII